MKWISVNRQDESSSSASAGDAQLIRENRCLSRRIASCLYDTNRLLCKNTLPRGANVQKFKDIQGQWRSQSHVNQSPSSAETPNLIFVIPRVFDWGRFHLQGEEIIDQMFWNKSLD